jgi:hypothetical protein
MRKKHYRERESQSYKFYIYLYIYKYIYIYKYTVKLGYNELGYNEHSVIINAQKIQSQMTNLLHKTTRL